MILLSVNDCFDLAAWWSNRDGAETLHCEGADDEAEGASRCISEGTANMLQYARYAYIAGVCGRALLLIVSIKKPQICKCYLMYELAVLLASQCSIQTLLADDPTASKINVLMVFILFNALYYNYALSMAMILPYLVVYHVVRNSMYGQAEAGKIVGQSVLSCAWIIVTLLPCHMMVTYAGMKFIENELSCVDNEEQLDSLKEGLVIVSLEHQILYQNKSGACALGTQSAAENADCILRGDVHLANCEAALAWDHAADYADTIAKLQSISAFKPIETIVSDEQQRGLPGQAHLFVNAADTG